jgi:hypothetical protein
LVSKPSLIKINHSKVFFDVVEELLGAQFSQNSVGIAVGADWDMDDLSVRHI